MLETLKSALEGLEDVRIFTSPREAREIADLKKALREQIRRVDKPEQMAAD